MATKYKEYFDLLFENHKDQLEEFKRLHDRYAVDPNKWQQEFNEAGQDILRVIRRYDNLLCGKSENSGFGKFSSNLSEKFWAEVRMVFPHIDSVGKLS